MIKLLVENANLSPWTSVPEHRNTTDVRIKRVGNYFTYPLHDSTFYFSRPLLGSFSKCSWWSAHSSSFLRSFGNVFTVLRGWPEIVVSIFNFNVYCITILAARAVLFCSAINKGIGVFFTPLQYTVTTSFSRPPTTLTNLMQTRKG